MTAGRGLLLARLAASVGALLGLVLLVVGGIRGGSADTAAEEASGTTRLDGVVAVTVRPDVLAGGATRVRVSASATTSATTVFVGVARADDVTAWVGDLARVDVLGAGEAGTLDIARTGTGRTAPDPVRADVWVALATGQGAAQLDWTPAPGQWRAVVVAGPAADGLERVDVSRLRPAGGSSAPALVATGLVLVVAGGVALLVLRRRGRRGPDDAGYDHDDSGFDSGRGFDSDSHRPGGGLDQDDEQPGRDGSPGGPGTTSPPRRRPAGPLPWARAVPLAVPCAVVLSLGATACSSGSSEGSAASEASGAVAAVATGTASTAPGTEPGYPAVLVPQAENILDKVDAALAAVDRSRTVQAAQGRVIGPAARRLTADLKVTTGTTTGTRSGTATSSARPVGSATSTAGMARDRLVLTQQVDWPRFFVVAGAAPGRPTPVVRVLVSPTARDPYGVWAEPVLLPGATLPEVAAAAQGAQTLPASAPGLVATPEQVAAGYADVLTKSTQSASSRLFAPDEFRRQVSSRVAQDRRGVAAVGTVTSTHTLLPDGLFSLRTADGGAVVVAALEQRYTIAVKRGAGSVTVDDRLAALGGKRAYATRLERRSVEVVVFTVPPAGGGLVRVVAAAKDDVAISGS